MDARFPGTCTTCGGPIEVGDSIIRVGDDEGWEHDFCPPDVDTDAKAEPCPKCFLIHRGECF